NAIQQATQQRTYSLEIRGVGLGIYHDGQSEIWDFIKKKNNNFSSIYSQKSEDYEASVDAREVSRDIKTRVAFQHSAGESVAYWPLPTFALAPPKQPSDTGAADSILTGRNAA
ncbi:type VI lipase adapter Tla3 domain-containing protein, partial [Pseudomonas viridiflava]